ncbi:MAG: glycosyltransferase family 39 protein, partial [Chloroflexota bacterium]
MPHRLELTLLACILLAALALRLYDLHGVPPGAQHDEVFSANFATQIIGGARPVYWDQNGGVPVLHAYLVAPVFAVFGRNIVTLRLVSVVCGLLVVLFTYLTARKLFGVGVALLSSALLSVTQWHLFE